MPSLTFEIKISAFIVMLITFQASINPKKDAPTQIDPNNAANNKTSSLTYDLMARIVSKQTNDGVSTYEYYTTTGTSTNKLKKTTGFAGNTEEYTYDSYGRMNTYKETIDAVAYNFTYGYNRYSDNINITYPSGLVIKNDYNRNGDLVKINSVGTTTTNLFTNNNENGLGQNTSYTLGNGKTSTTTYNYGIVTNYATTGIQNLTMVWDYSSRNLTSRTDGIINKSSKLVYQYECYYF